MEKDRKEATKIQQDEIDAQGKRVRNIVISAMAGGSSVIAITKLLGFGKKMVDHYVPITDDNINSTVLGQAIQQKWSGYSSTIDLSTQEGWLQLSQGFGYIGEPALARNCIADYYYVANLTTGKVPYTKLLKDEDLANYVSSQDPTERIADHIKDAVTKQITDAVDGAFFDKWHFSVDASCYVFGDKAYDLGTAESINELLEDYTLAKTWTGGFTREHMEKIVNRDIGNSGVDSSVYDKNFEDMTDAEYGQVVMDIMTRDNHRTYTGEEIVERMDNNKDHEASAIASMGDAQDYYEAKAFHDGAYQNMDINDLFEHFGAYTRELDGLRDLVANERADILEQALEAKYGLPADTVDMDYSNKSIWDKIDDNVEGEYADDYLACAANVYSVRNGAPADTTAEQISDLHVRQIIDDMIANGDTVNYPREEGLSTAQCGGIGGVGAAISFGIVTAMYMRKRHQLAKAIQASPEAAKNYHEYVQEQKSKETKRAKKSTNEVQENDAEEKDSQLEFKRK